ncbi:hypothetical protein [Vibrio sp. WXL103]|uniref:hypothetical protein n=1 Tax=Vibrio sp. WXL103 TaxID=3450710 RepID=UPI003EC4C0DF
MSDKKHIILVVHGMGTHPEGSTLKTFTESVNLGLKHCGIGWKIEQKADIREFNYSEYLDDHMKNDAAYAKSLLNVLPMMEGRGFVEDFAIELTEELSKFDEESFFYNNWLDVIYYSLLLQGVHIRVMLAEKVAEILKEANLHNKQVHIVAHSLGTAVVHDTLAQLFVKDSPASYDAEITKLDTDRHYVDSVWMIANVSRLVNLLNGIADPNHSIVSSDVGGCANSFYNVANEFDPFTWVKEYNRKIEIGLHIETRLIRDINTHSLKEYVSDPKFIIEFIDRLEDEYLTEEATATAHEQFNKEPKPSIQHDYEAIREQVKIAKEDGNAVEGILAFYEAIKLSHDFYKRLDEMI